MNKREILETLHEVSSRLEDVKQWKLAYRLDDVFLKIAKSQMPDEMKSGHKSAPKGYPKDKSKYADPVNFKYPIDTEAHARAAWAYIHQERNRKKYEPKEFEFMSNRIKKALKKFDVEIEEQKKK